MSSNKECLCDNCKKEAPDGGKNSLGYFCSDACSEEENLKRKFSFYKKQAEVGSFLYNFVWMTKKIHTDWKFYKLTDRQFIKLMDMLNTSSRSEWE